MKDEIWMPSNLTEEEKEEYMKDYLEREEEYAKAEAEEKAARYSPSGVSYDSYEGCE